MKISRRRFAALLLAAVAVSPVEAAPAAADAGVALLHRWLGDTRGGRASFTQSVVDAKGHAGPPAAGNFEFERPGRFRWAYTRPYAQDIVSDGSTIWTFDKDLDQVTISHQSSVLRGTPASLLAGADVDRLFVLTAMPDADGLHWVQAVPRAQDNAFAWVRIGLSEGADGPVLARMQLRDAFRRTTTIVFAQTVRNPRFAPGYFHFDVPKGASVIDQP